MNGPKPGYSLPARIMARWHSAETSKSDAPSPDRLDRGQSSGVSGTGGLSGVLHLERLT